MRKKNDCGKDMQMKECLKFLSEREQPDGARDRGVPSKQACHTYPSCERRRRRGHPRCGRHTDVFCHECLRVRTSDALPSRSDLRVFAHSLCPIACCNRFETRFIGDRLELSKYRSHVGGARAAHGRVNQHVATQEQRNLQIEDRLRALLRRRAGERERARERGREGGL